MGMRYEHQYVGYTTLPDPPDYGCDYEFDEDCRECEHYEECKKCSENYYDD